MRVLVACEESQTVCKAFREKGHEAYSCDLQESSGGHPEWHITGDALKLLKAPLDFTTDSGSAHHVDEWDLLIAHPPCTYLSNAGATHLFPEPGVLNEERYRLGLEGRELFMSFYNAPISRVCVENPTPLSIFNMPPHYQVIQPYEYGHPYSKRTLLWLKNLPFLMPTDIIDRRSVESTVTATWFNKGGKDRQKRRSVFWKGIADAMADQWGKLQ